VCDDYWDVREAHVVCRQLGYTGVATYPGAFGRGFGHIWMDDVNWGGGESSLLNYGHRGWASQNSNHWEDARVVLSV